MRKYSLLKMLAFSGILSLAVQPQQVLAQWPTLDVSSVKEGITSNIEMVKQSKVVTDAMATAGKINAGIGDAMGSVSKFAGDNLKKAQEEMKKLQEEKERIEKRKEEYEEIKKEMEEKKEAIEEYKRQAEAMKSDAEGYMNDAKEMKEAASSMASEAKDIASQNLSGNIGGAEALSAATSDNLSATGTPASLDLSTPESVASATQGTISSGRTAFGIQQAISDLTPQVLVPNSNAKNYGEATGLQAKPQLTANGLTVATLNTEKPDIQKLTEEQQRLQEEMDALDKEKAELEVEAMFAKTPEEKAAIEEKIKALDEKYGNLSKQMEENKAKIEEGMKEEAAESETEEGKGDAKEGEEAEVENDKEAGSEEEADKEDAVKEGTEGEEEEKEEQPFHRAKILDGETSTKMEIPESHRAKILDTYQAPQDHRPKILDEYEKQRSQSTSGGFRKKATPKTSSIEDRHYATRSFSETIAFADATGGDVPDGTVNGVFIFSNRLAQECEVNVESLEDENVIDECIKKIVKEKSDKDATIAQEAESVYKGIMQETINALAAESMARKNEAANYETEVLSKLEEQIANTKNNRDDTSGLSLTNMETQYLLNRIITIYSAQLSLDALEAVGGFDKSYYQDGDDEEEKESGEE